MSDIIFVSDEYSTAEVIFKKIATDTYTATESFKKCIQKMVDNNDIKGVATQNMIAFLSTMSNVLRATFKEQIFLEATLCNDYVKCIIDADKYRKSNTAIKGVKDVSFAKIHEAADTKKQIILNKGEVSQSISNIKAGPIADISSCISSAKDICFKQSSSLVKEQIMSVIDNTIVSLEALLDIFNVFIDCIEGIMTVLENTDAGLVK
jgi:hypothetical protein